MKEFFKKLYRGSKIELMEQLVCDLKEDRKRFIVTANPETFMLSKEDKAFHALLLESETTVVADGIGIIKGAQLLDYNITERIPGVEIALALLQNGDILSKRVFLFGAKQEVLEALCEKIRTDYPNLVIAGAVNGYVEDQEAVFKEIKAASADIVLVALGVPKQEKLIAKYIHEFSKGIFVGVGGSFDVLSGTKQRAPNFFIKHNIEWFYRIIKEPKRLKRFYTKNIKFLFEVKKTKHDLRHRLNYRYK